MAPCSVGFELEHDPRFENVPLGSQTPATEGAPLTGNTHRLNVALGQYRPAKSLPTSKGDGGTAMISTSRD